MGNISFRCPNCGNPYNIPSERIPAHGARGACKGCSTLLTVFPDGRVATPSDVPQPGPYPPPSVSPPPPLSPAAPIPSQPAPPVPPPPAIPIPAPPAPSQGDTVVFTCPSCGKDHRIPKARIPATGARGKCSGCGLGVFVTPDGQARLLEEPPKLSLQTPSAAPDAPGGGQPPALPRLVETAPSATWEIQFEDQVLGPFPFVDLKQLILTDKLPPDRMVRATGGDWGPAAAFAVFAPLYAPHETGEGGEEPFGGETKCFRHPAVQPTHLCSQCHRHMCSSCVKGLQTHTGVKTLAQCPVCGGLAEMIKRRKQWTPFYLDVAQALKAPFTRGNASFYFGLLAIMQVCKIPCSFMPILGLAGVLVLTIFQTTFYLHVVRSVGNGSYDFPEWPDAGNYMDMVVSFLKVFFVTLVAILPVILLGCIGGAGLAGAAGGLLGGRGGDGALLAVLGPWVALMVLLIVFYAMYLPVCIAIVAVFDTVLPALNPVIIFKIIFRFGPTYFLAVALWVALVAINAFSMMILGGMGIFGSLLHAPVEVYTSLVMAYILGRVVYENEERVGWY